MDICCGRQGCLEDTAYRINLPLATAAGSNRLMVYACEPCRELLEQLDWPQPIRSDPLRERRCRECGCTERDACVDEHGEPCAWAEADLCSACLVRVALPADPF